jgi:hypothetical protein
MARTPLQLLLESFKSRGIAETIALAKKNLAYWSRWYWDRSFDRRFHTDTSGQISLDDLGVSSPNRPYGVYYEPTSTKIFRYILAHVKIEYEKFVFVDFGSGKGRTLLLASSLPFKAIVGVEFSSTLHAIALNNIAIYRSERQRCRDITSVCADAADYELPKQDTAFYFYHPFDTPVMSKVLDRIQASVAETPRKIVIIYHNPLLAGLVETYPFVVAKTEVKLPFDPSRSIQRRLIVYRNWR